jgi:hypothetical protein
MEYGPAPEIRPARGRADIMQPLLALVQAIPKLRPVNKIALLWKVATHPEYGRAAAALQPLQPSSWIWAPRLA